MKPLSLVECHEKAKEILFILMAWDIPKMSAINVISSMEAQAKAIKDKDWVNPMLGTGTKVLGPND